MMRRFQEGPKTPGPFDLAERNELTAKTGLEPPGWLGSSIPIRKEPS
jgi:hypothetical protein